MKSPIKSFLLCSLIFLIANCRLQSSPHSNKSKKLDNIESVMLIGWDGSNRPVIQRLLLEKKLPNLAALIEAGSFVETEVKIDQTETKPQWSQILTGYTSKVHGVFTNLIYGPIPKGLTIFERLHDKFGHDIEFAFVSGKINNVSFRGPHEICVNCLFRLENKQNKKLPWGFISEKSQLNFAAETAPTRHGQKRIIAKRDGQPYYTLHQQGFVKYMINSLNEGDNVLKYTMSIIEPLTRNRFFAFIHFEEPDEQGHQFGEGTPEYIDGILKNDRRLGEIIAKLKELNRFNKTAIIVTTDHGFDTGKRSHMDSPHTFLVSTIKNLKKNSTPQDVAPTIYDIFGVDTDHFEIKLEGSSLIQ